MVLEPHHIICCVLLLQVAQALQANMLRRCVQHWKAWVDQRVDWRSFGAQVVQHMTRSRCADKHYDGVD